MRRLRDLSAGHPVGLEYVAIFPGPQAAESKLQKRFAHYRARREWFSEDVLAEVINLLGTKAR